MTNSLLPMGDWSASFFLIFWYACATYSCVCPRIWTTSIKVMSCSLFKSVETLTSCWILNSALGNSPFFPPTTSKRGPTCKSMNGLLPRWMASSFPQRMVSSMNGPPLSQQMASCLSRQMASPLGKWPPPSLDGWPPLLVNGLLPPSMDSLLPPLENGLLPPLTNSLLPPSMNGLVLLADGLPSLNEQLSPSLD